MVDNLIYRTKESVNKFKEDPINNLGFLIPVAIALISLGSGIVTYIMYIFNGGYTVQINAAKKYGWFGGYRKIYEWDNRNDNFRHHRKDSFIIDWN